MAKRKVVMYRSAKSGKAVTKAFADEHPDTTVKDTYRRKPSRKKKRS
jgi:hypothetical protein